MFGDLGRDRRRHTLKAISLSFIGDCLCKGYELTAFTELVQLLEGFNLATIACDESE